MFVVTREHCACRHEVRLPTHPPSLRTTAKTTCSSSAAVALGGDRRCRRRRLWPPPAPHRRRGAQRRVDARCRLPELAGAAARRIGQSAARDRATSRRARPATADAAPTPARRPRCRRRATAAAHRRAPRTSATRDPKDIASADARRLRLGLDQFGCLDPLWPQESAGTERRQPVVPRVRHPAGPPRLQDGLRRRRLGRPTPPPRSMGPRLHHDRYGTPCGAWGHTQSIGWQVDHLPSRRVCPADSRRVGANVSRMLSEDLDELALNVPRTWRAPLAAALARARHGLPDLEET